MFSPAVLGKTPRARAPFGKAQPLMIPYKGLNARSPFSTMGSEYAIALNNVLVETYGLRCRKGWQKWATGLPGTTPVKTIMHYFPATAVPAPSTAKMPLQFSDYMVVTPRATHAPSPGKLFAAKGGFVYDVTAGGPGPWVAQSGISGLTDFWHTCNLQNIAGAFLIATNEGGGYAIYNGANWVTPTQGTAVGQIEGCDPALFCYVIT